MSLVFLVEDDSALREALTLALEREGHTVAAFDDAVPAINSPQLSAADVIVTDLMMRSPAEPLIRHARGLSPDVPIIVISGYLTAEDWERVGDLGATCFVAKPLMMSEFLATVNQYVADSPSPSPGEASPSDG